MKAFTEKRVSIVILLLSWVLAGGAPALAASVTPPHFSHTPGLYEQPFVLTIDSPEPQTVIRYTLDGSEPAADHGFVYFQGISIAHTACIRAAAFKSTTRSAVVTSTYLLNTSEAIRSLPILSLVGDEAETFYLPNGIGAIQGGVYTGNYVSWRPVSPGDYNFALQHGRAFERPVSAELILSDGSRAFQADCGIRINGSTYTRSRYRTSSKFSFRLYFRQDHGPKRLGYPLIPDAPVPDFDRIVLRAGQSDAVNPFLKDELGRRLQRDMSGDACLGTFVNLFINGHYQGYYNPVERIDEKMFQSRFGSDLSWDVVTQWRPEDDDYDWQPGDPVDRPYRFDVRDGDPNAMNALLDYALAHDLRSSEHYRHVADRVDIVQFIDYLILEGYLGHRDWPHNNWTAVGARSAGHLGQWRFYAWDLEHSFYESDVDSAFKTPSSGGDTQPVGILYEQLLVNDTFRRLFADRVQQHFFHGGALQASNVITRFDRLRAILAGVLPHMNTSIRDTWAHQRPGAALASLQDKGLCTLEGPRLYINDTPYDGQAVYAGDALTLQNPQDSGAIYYTLDGTDPFDWPSEARSDGSDPDEGYAHAQRGYATYEYWLDVPGSRISDLTAHPAFPAEPTGTETLTRFESPVRWADNYGARIYGYLYPPETGDYVFWITSDNDGELHLSSTADPAGKVRIATVSGWTSPQQWDKYPSQQSAPIRLKAGRRYAIEALYKEANGGDHVAVAWQGPGLSQQVIDGQYLSPADEAWTTGPETATPVLAPAALEYAGEPIPPAERTTINARTFDGQSWSARTQAVFTTGSFLWINEVMSHNVAMIGDPNDPAESPDWIELYNPTDTVVDLAGLCITDDLRTPLKSRLPAGLTIAPHDFLLLWADGDPQQGTRHLSFKLDRQGEPVGIYDPHARQWIDLVHVPALGPDQSFARHPDGAETWTLCPHPSPGRPNSDGCTGRL